MRVVGKYPTCSSGIIKKTHIVVFLNDVWQHTMMKGSVMRCNVIGSFTMSHGQFI
jgi:hypothetical protein